MSEFESKYASLVERVRCNGQRVDTRSGPTLSCFGETLQFDLKKFPILEGRRIFYRGVLGEFAAMLKGPKSVQDFKDQGCNFWGNWADEDGSLRLDYGNAWTDYNGVNQLHNVIQTLRTNPTDRRMIINAWRPDRLDDLSLPCCHYNYQFYVRKDNLGRTYLDMEWVQRSTDIMIGLPSDAILAAVWVISLAALVGMEPGRVYMRLGDSHIYENHSEGVETYLANVEEGRHNSASGGVDYYYQRSNLGEEDSDTQGADLIFTPSDLVLFNYSPQRAIKFDIAV